MFPRRRTYYNHFFFEKRLILSNQIAANYENQVSNQIAGDLPSALFDALSQAGAWGEDEMQIYAPLQSIVECGRIPPSTACGFGIT